MKGRIGVCSWSLRPEGPEDLARKAKAAGLAHVQLALDPLRDGRWKLDETRAVLAKAGITVVSGMMSMMGEDYTTLESIRATGGVRVDKNWKQNLERAEANAALAHELGLKLVTFHAGFLPESRSDPVRTRMIERLRALCDVFAAQGLVLGLETGQEGAETLLAVLARIDKPNAGVNFDPANMILYGKGDPVAALKRLGPHVRQVHVKDARASAKPGRWGSEVPAGKGEVRWPEFFALVRALPQSIDLVIEREAGEERAPDIVTARKLVESGMGVPA